MIVMYVEIGLFLNALILGTMSSFMVVTSPAVFKTLDEDHSKKFLRYIFPRLFNFCFLIRLNAGDKTYYTFVNLKSADYLASFESF